MSAQVQNLLCVVLDCHPGVWAAPPYSPKHFLYTCEQLLMFINAHLLLDSMHTVCVIAALPQRSRFLYPVPGPSSANLQPAADRQPVVASATAHRGFSHVALTIVQQLQALAEEIAQYHMMQSNNQPAPQDSQQPPPPDQPDVRSHRSPADPNRPTSLAGALSLALCYLNRAGRESSGAAGPAATAQLVSRILVVCPELDSTFQFVPCMNAVFSAQKRGIPIDVLLLNPEGRSRQQQQQQVVGGTGTGGEVSAAPGVSSLLLEQAADLTDGLFWGLDQWRWLGQWLLNLFLPDSRTRGLLALPSRQRRGWNGQDSGLVAGGVDYRATCFCHRRVVDMGFVCPVCLSVFCKSTAACPTCSSRFAVPLTADGGGKSSGDE